MTNATKPPHDDDAIREHTFDGIQEYDKHMPNWWLLTFYGAIVFWIGYWFFFEQSRMVLSTEAYVDQEMRRIEAVRLSSSAGQLDDATLWQMSRNAVLVDAGRNTFNTTCASCHLADLRGTDAGGIAPNLADETWIHGSKPTDLIQVVDKGVLAKGMPAWGPVIGAKKVSEVVAYILSHHAEPK